MLDGQPNWQAVVIAGIAMLGTVAANVITFLLTRSGQKGMSQKADAREAKLDQVHLKVAKTEVLVNGDRQAKERRIAELEATMRANGLELP